MSPLLLLLFIVGLIHDSISAYYLKLVTEKRYILASLISTVITILGYGIFFAITHELTTGNYLNLFVYSAGGGIGTYLGLKIKT